MPPAPEHRDSIANSSGDLLLAVDAGGTKTAAWLVDLHQSGSNRVLGRGRAGAGNPLSVGFDDATRALKEAIAGARDDAKLPASRLPRLILSVAGAANEEVSKQFVDWVHSLGLAERVAVVSDVLPILAAGTPDCCGVALISGTGSVACVRAKSGQTKLCGGWGYLLGDEGSGYAIGRAALQHALHALESIDAKHPLAEATRRTIGANTVMELTKAIYEDADPRGVIASVSPVVIAAAEEGDPDAQAILDTAAFELATLVARAIRPLIPPHLRIPLAVAGGVLVSSKQLRDQLEVKLRRFGLMCDMRLIDEPLAGCVRLAAPEFAGTLVKWQ